MISNFLKQLTELVATWVIVRKNAVGIIGCSRPPERRSSVFDKPVIRSGFQFICKDRHLFEFGSEDFLHDWDLYFKPVWGNFHTFARCHRVIWGDFLHYSVSNYRVFTMGCLRMLECMLSRPVDNPVAFDRCWKEIRERGVVTLKCHHSVLIYCSAILQREPFLHMGKFVIVVLFTINYDRVIRYGMNCQLRTNDSRNLIGSKDEPR